MTVLAVKSRTIAFETLSCNGEQVTIENDLDNEQQTLHFPILGTTAKGKVNMLVKEYEMILKGKEQETENAFMDHIFNTMEYLNSFYGRIYLFKEFYNALLNNSHEVRYQAILDLLDKFGEKNKEIGRVYQKYGNKEWCILSKNLKCNRGRMEIKRIIGVMANKELRKKYFGF